MNISRIVKSVPLFAAPLPTEHRLMRCGQPTIEEVWREPGVTDVQIIGDISDDVVLIAVTVTLTTASSSPWKVPDYVGAISVTVNGAGGGGGSEGFVFGTAGNPGTAGGQSKFNTPTDVI